MRTVNMHEAKTHFLLLTGDGSLARYPGPIRVLRAGAPLTAG